jgi:TatD DNase family protein
MNKDTLKIIDSHAHLNSEDYPMDFEGAINRAKAASIKKIMNICTSPSELIEGLALEKKYPELIRNIASTTPHDADKETKETFAFFEKHALCKNLVAIGETGFDDFIQSDNRKEQMDVCLKYIDLAVRSNLPVVFHVRGEKAFENLFLAASKNPPFNGVIHCFTGNLSQVEKALALGWYLSISGIATFKKSLELKKVIQHIPINRLLIETDAPWLAPEGYRGKDNEPSYIHVLIKTLAEIYELSFEELSQKTFDNASKVFSL